jgi:hypothetical protein
MLLFTLSALSLKAQIAEVNVAQIALINPNDKSAGLILNEDFEKCIRILGQPDAISNVYSEIDEDTMKLYKYGQNELYFLQGKLTSYEIKDSSIWVGEVNGQIFKIGDRLTSRSARPANFQGLIINRYAGESRNMSFAFASINEIKNGNNYLDSYFELLFDSQGMLFSICKGDK